MSSGSFLKEKLAQAIRANPQYSLRAFAAKLELSPSGLSQILSGKKRISLERAHQIARTLKLSSTETEHLTLLVQIEGCKSQAIKAEFIEKLLRLGLDQEDTQVHQLSLDHFNVMSEWYGLATMAYLTHAKTAVGEAAQAVAKKFKISTIEAGTMIDRLERLELIERTPEGFYKRLEDRVLVHSMTPNEALRKYFKSISQKFDASITEQTPKEKTIGTEVFMFDPTQIPELKKVTYDYLDAVQKLAETGKSRTKVYQAIAAAFDLEK